jgi:hypothetical protein
LSADDHQASIVVDRLVASKTIELVQNPVVDLPARSAPGQTPSEALETVGFPCLIEGFDQAVGVQEQGVTRLDDLLVAFEHRIDAHPQRQRPRAQLEDPAVGTA